MESWDRSFINIEEFFISPALAPRVQICSRDGEAVEKHAYFFSVYVRLLFCCVLLSPNRQTGNGIYEGVPTMSDLRLLAYLHKEHFTIAVRKDSGIKTIDDIRGKRVNIGAPGALVSENAIGFNPA